LNSLKILNSLKALIAENTLYSESCVWSSRRDTTTIMKSNLLKESFKYSLKPNPMTFKTTSRVKMPVNTMLALDSISEVA